MLDIYLARAVEDLASMRPHVTVFGCTSAGALRGASYDDQLCAGIAATTGSPTISTARALTDAIAETGVGRIAVLTPYTHELNVKIRESVEEAGVRVAEIDGFGIADTFRMAEPAPDEVAARAIDLIRRSDPELLVIPCTNFAGLEAVSIIRRSVSTPVVTSNLAVLRAIAVQRSVMADRTWESEASDVGSS